MKAQANAAQEKPEYNRNDVILSNNTNSQTSVQGATVPGTEINAMSIKTTYHRDGTVTYWSVYNQVWVRRASSVPNKELAAMSGNERERVQRHLGQGQSEHATKLIKVCAWCEPNRKGKNITHGICQMHKDRFLKGLPMSSITKGI